MFCTAQLNFQMPSPWQCWLANKWSSLSKDFTGLVSNYIADNASIQLQLLEGFLNNHAKEGENQVPDFFMLNCELNVPSLDRRTKWNLWTVIWVQKNCYRTKLYLGYNFFYAVYFQGENSSKELDWTGPIMYFFHSFICCGCCCSCKDRWAVFGSVVLSSVHYWWWNPKRLWQCTMHHQENQNEAIWEQEENLGNKTAGRKVHNTWFILVLNSH